ncbi:MAG TPA: ATP-binding protein [Verrucomicrobiae bacterium]|nr:ATP-binding protein [Verrucomicrobiae bacterium]
MAAHHNLLARQLRQYLGCLGTSAEELKAGFGCAGTCSARLSDLLNAVNEAYTESDNERTMLERSLHLSSQEVYAAMLEMRGLLQAFPDLYFRLDASGKILDVKTGSDVDLHVPSSQLLGKRIQDDPSKRVAEKFAEAIAQIQQTQSLVSIEYAMKLRGEQKYFEARLLPLPENQILVVVRNITKNKQAEEALHVSEEQLRQSQKMEAIGRLAGGVAHDFNNLLTVILGHCELLVEQIQTGKLSPESVEEVQSAAQRASQLTRQLLAFSRKQVLQPKVLNLNDVVVGIEKMTRRLIGEDIELRTVLTPSLGLVTADPGQIEQVILNLVVNARDAMPHGGRILIETNNVNLDQASSYKHRQLEPGDYVMLVITDTGVGMTDSVKEHLFEPFFTTKGPGKGTGLGLATCFGIVRQSGGDIRVYSEPNRGTAFKIFFPRTGQSAATEVPASANASPNRGSETVLLIEDEASVRRLAGSVLRSCGYIVHEACDGAEALQLLSSEHSPRFDLIVSDMVMPRMGGKEVLECVQLKQPRIKVLLVSGYTDDALVDRGALGPGVAFLEKPFSARQLAQRVREVLDEPSAFLEQVTP